MKSQQRQQRQQRQRICQDKALLNKYSDGAALTDEEKKRVQRLQKNAQQRTRRRRDAALLNKYYVDAVTVMDEEEKRVHPRLDAAPNRKYWMRYHRNTMDMVLGQLCAKRRHDFITSDLKGEGVVPMMQLETMPIVSEWLSSKMNMIAISL